MRSLRNNEQSYFIDGGRGWRRGRQRAGSYERLRAAHLHQIRAALDDHVKRVGWPRERIERYRTERLRGLLGYARERSPFHAARLRGFDPSTATVADLVRLPPMTKREAQDEWDAIIPAPRLRRAGAERILAEQTWFSYAPEGEQVFSSGGSSGVRGVYVWDWSLLVTLACLAWRMQARGERNGGGDPRPARLAVLEAGGPPHPSTPLCDVPTTADMETIVIPAAQPFDEVAAAVQRSRATHLGSLPPLAASPTTATHWSCTCATQSATDADGDRQTCSSDRSARSNVARR